jgi:hypothetical protein
VHESRSLCHFHDLASVNCLIPSIYSLASTYYNWFGPSYTAYERLINMLCCALFFISRDIRLNLCVVFLLSASKPLTVGL